MRVRRLSGPRWLPLAALPALALAGCATLGGSPSATSAKIAELERQLAAERRRATVAEVESARYRREIARLEAQLEQVAQAAEPPAPEPVFEPVPEAGRDPEIEETDLEAPPVTVAPPAPPAAPEPSEPSSPEPSSPEPTPPEPTSAEAQALYDQAYTAFHEQRYAEAETRFESFVELYPRSDLADNALFWIGESRFARRDFSSALDAFTDTVERYPQGNKVADAMLKAGKCLEALGEVEQARGTYREVARLYPGSAAAAQARERLDQLR